MKGTKLRGMRDVPSIQGLRHRSVPGNREQVVAQIARLEHEKARLGREMRIWLDNQERTQKRIHQVEELLVALQDALEPPTEKDTQRRTRGSCSQAGTEDAGSGQAQRWTEVPLEY